MVAVSEVPSLLGREDAVHFALMQSEKRAIVTENASDFRPLLKLTVKNQSVSYGLILVSPRRFRRSKNSIGHLIKALDLLLRQYPKDDSLCDREVWLTM